MHPSKVGTEKTATCAVILGWVFMFLVAFVIVAFAFLIFAAQSDPEAAKLLQEILELFQ